MKFLIAFTALVASASAFAPLAPPARTVSRSAPLQMADTAEADVKIFDQEQFIAESKEMRLQHLEEQAMYALKIAVENYGNAVFRKFVSESSLWVSCNLT